MTSKLYILLPVHNRCATTEKFIDCLVAQTYTNYHLILIDDGSIDGTSDMVRARVYNLTVLRGTGNWWWAGSLQQGINWLRRNAEDDDCVVFMNDDVTFAVDFLQRAVRLLERHGGMLLPQVLDEEAGRVEETGVEADLRRLTFRNAPSPERINCLPTRGLFMSVAVMRRVGDFHPRLLPHYLSDYEYTIRAHRLGISLTTFRDLTISLDRNVTGHRSFDDESFTVFLKKYFSIKSTSNPLYWSSFVMLAADKASIPWLLLVVWMRAVRQILKKVIWSVAGRGRSSTLA